MKVTKKKVIKRSASTRAKKTALLSDKDVAEVFDRLALAWPNAHCELLHNTPFQLLIAVVLSAQTTDRSVNIAMEPLLKSQPHFGPADLIQLGEAGFLKIIKRIGLAPTKAKNCFNLSKVLVQKFKSQVPTKREELEDLPGVGRKTANVVLNVLYGEPTMPVDTHVARLAVRIGLVERTENRKIIEDELLRKIPTRHLGNAHHLLIFHGRYHCTAKLPKCSTCPLLGLCPRIGVDRSV